MFREIGFSPSSGSYLTGPAVAEVYFRINGGDLIRSQLADDSVRAERGDHVELLIDFDRPLQGTETVFEYTIPDDPDLRGVLAGFAECCTYHDDAEWVVEPLRVNLDTDFRGRPRETLVVTVDRGVDADADWFVWNHTNAIRSTVRGRAAESDPNIDVSFLDPSETATFYPREFRRVRTIVADGDEWVSGVSFPEPDADG